MPTSDYCKHSLLGYPKNLSAWPGLPSSIDAAVQWAGNSHIYFFKDREYWKFDTAARRMATGYPRKIATSWTGVPDDLDAALVYRGKTYFFKETFRNHVKPTEAVEERGLN